MSDSASDFGRLTGKARSRLSRTLDVKWWLERTQGRPLAALSLSSGPHLFLDWRFIQPGMPSYLSKEGKPYGLVEPDELGEIEAVVGRHRDSYAGPQEIPAGIRIEAEMAAKSDPFDNDQDAPGHTTIFDGNIYRTWGVKSCSESRDGFEWGGHQPYSFDWSDCEVQWDAGVGATVFIDPHAEDSERYKTVMMTLARDVKGGKEFMHRVAEDFLSNRPDEVDPNSLQPFYFHIIFGAVSPDGIHWKVLPDQLMMQVSDTLNVLTYDEGLQKYVWYGRCWWYFGRRCIFRAETDDFTRWPAPEPIIWPEAGDHPSDDWYTNSKTMYPGTTDHHLMFPALFHRASDSTSLYLFSSPDGIAWTRVPGGPVLKPGPFGSFDASCIFDACGLVPLPGERVGMIFRGYNYPHKYPRNKYTMQPKAAYALWDSGRLASVRADDEGSFATWPLLLPGKSLRLNVETHRSGWIRVAAEDNQGKTLPGKGFDDCVPIVGNHRNVEVAWKSGSDLGYGIDQPILLRFRMKHTKLFGFELR